MDDGLNLAQPPIPAWRPPTRQLAHQLLAQSAAYGNAAGGFDQVTVTPQAQRLRTPLAPIEHDARLVELYGEQPELFRQRIERMFPPNSRPPGR